MNHLQQHDPAVWDAIEAEAIRQQDGLEMIASENYTSLAIMQAAGSVLTNKYAEDIRAADITVDVNTSMLSRISLLSGRASYLAPKLPMSSLTVGRRPIRLFISVVWKREITSWDSIWLKVDT